MLVETQESLGNLVLRSTLKKESMPKRCVAGRRLVYDFFTFFFLPKGDMILLLLLLLLCCGTLFVLDVSCFPSFSNKM